MESNQSTNGRLRFSGARALVGRTEDYRNPIPGVTRIIQDLLVDYVASGGDLENVQLTIGTTRDHGRVSREHTIVRLDGYSR